MQKYTLKNPEVSAVQWDGGNLDEVVSLIGCSKIRSIKVSHDSVLSLDIKQEDVLAVEADDFIVRHANNHIEIFDNPSFIEEYEKYEESEEE